MPSLLPAHTGLRAIAALLVVGFHYSIAIGPPGAIPSAVLRNGYLGVDLFFVLSGFILHHVYRAKFDRTTFRARYGAFLRYRLARIYPVHLAILLALIAFQCVSSAASGQPMPVEYSGGAILAALLLVQSWIDIAVPNAVSWSVSAEWFAYLVYPAALVAGQRLSPVVKLAALVPLLLALHFLWEANPLFRIVPEFALGVFAYEAALRLHPRLRKARWLGTAAFAAMLLTMGAFGPALIVPIGLCFAVLLVGLVNPSDWLGRILCGSAFLYLGEISYSLYMVHSPWREILRRGAHRFDFDLASGLGMVLSVGTALGLAALAYHALEMPARRLLRGRRAGTPQDMALTPLGTLTPVPLAERGPDQTFG